MANAFRTTLAPLVIADGAWIRCAAPDCDAYWGAFRPTAHVLAKAQAHAAKAHGARPRAAGLRPQRRAAQPQGADAGLIEAAVAAVLALGPARLGRGVSREVFPFGPDYVLKVAFDPTQGHNLAEAKAWATAPAWARPHLAPVVKHDPKGVWLLMRRADRCGEATHGEAKAFGRNELRDRIGDIHEGNVAWIEGRMVAIDYAGGWGAREVQW